MQHRGGRTLHIGYGKHWCLALQVSHHNSLRMLLLQLNDGLYREFLVYMAATVPEQHVSACYAVDIVAEVVIRTKDNLRILWETVDYLLGIATGHHAIGQSLHGSGGIHIAYHLVAWVLFLILLQILSLAAVGKRAAGIQVRAEHNLVWTQELAGFSHEVHAAHHHHLSFCFSSLTSQSQRITHKVGNILNLAYSIVVRQDNRIFLLAKLSDFSFQV